MNGTELRSFSHFQILKKSHILAEIFQLTNFFKFVFIHIKAVKVSQNDQIQM